MQDEYCIQDPNYSYQVPIGTWCLEDPKYFEEFMQDTKYFEEFFDVPVNDFVGATNWTRTTQGGSYVGLRRTGLTAGKEEFQQDSRTPHGLDIGLRRSTSVIAAIFSVGSARDPDRDTQWRSPDGLDLGLQRSTPVIAAIPRHHLQTIENLEHVSNRKYVKNERERAASSMWFLSLKESLVELMCSTCGGLTS